MYFAVKRKRTPAKSDDTGNWEHFKQKLSIGGTGRINWVSSMFKFRHTNSLYYIHRYGKMSVGLRNNLTASQHLSIQAAQVCGWGSPITPGGATLNYSFHSWIHFELLCCYGHLSKHTHAVVFVGGHISSQLLRTGFVSPTLLPTLSIQEEFHKLVASFPLSCNTSHFFQLRKNATQLEICK